MIENVDSLTIIIIVIIITYTVNTNSPVKYTFVQFIINLNNFPMSEYKSIICFI